MGAFTLIVLCVLPLVFHDFYFDILETKYQFYSAAAIAALEMCIRDSQKVYIQVTYLLASDETIQREFGIYDSIHDNFPKYVVSMDELDFSRNGIKHRNIKEFLLMQEWN